MRHYRSLDEIQLKGAWVTIGSFDGVHRGHQALLNRLVQGAQAAGQPSAVVTFFPHPAIVLRGLQGPFYLSSPDERAMFIGNLGIEHVLTLNFNRGIASQTAQEFMENLVAHLGCTRLLVGQDFAIGRGRHGDIHTLRQIGLQLGYQLEVVPPTLVNSQLISSTRIREMVVQGQVSEAANLLGRWYSITGKVVRGDGRGQQIGIPTANLALWNERILPARGVYATLAWIHDRAVPAVTNIGLRPTFETGTALARVEAHLLDFSEDLYGTELRLEFVKFLRNEQRFNSARALLDQIRVDIQNAREVLPYVP